MKLLYTLLAVLAVTGTSMSLRSDDDVSVMSCAGQEDGQSCTIVGRSSFSGNVYRLPFGGTCQNSHCMPKPGRLLSTERRNKVSCVAKTDGQTCDWVNLSGALERNGGVCQDGTCTSTKQTILPEEGSED